MAILADVKINCQLVLFFVFPYGQGILVDAARHEPNK
jgi:hypothetical protein